MDENTFQKKMAELIQRIQDLPGTSPGNEGPQGTEDPAGNGLQGPLGELQESLDYLRLSVKYLVFDLEATRRENAYLRRLVEQSNRRREQSREQDDEHD